MCAQVKVQREPLATALKCALRMRERESTHVSSWLTDETNRISTAGISENNKVSIELLFHKANCATLTFQVYIKIFILKHIQIMDLSEEEGK